MSTQGMIKKTPGPLAPPDSSRPSLNMTALSYSLMVLVGNNYSLALLPTWTTFTTKKREKGRVIMMRRMEQTTMR